MALLLNLGYLDVTVTITFCKTSSLWDMSLHAGQYHFTALTFRYLLYITFRNPPCDKTDRMDANYENRPTSPASLKSDRSKTPPPDFTYGNTDDR